MCGIDSPKFEIVICVAQKDISNIDLTIQCLNKNLPNHKIVIVTGDVSNSKYELKNENNILKGLTYKNIEDYFIKRNVQPSRIGWYLQQFIKMAYAYVCQNDYYLVWDADTLMLNPIEFFDAEGRILYDNSRIWQDEVFNKTVNKVLGYPRACDETYIVEHMMINKSCMKDLISTIIKDKPVEDFWRLILDKISDEDLIYGGFSEFELIGTFMKKNYPDVIASRPLRSNRNAANVVGKNPNIFDFRFLEANYDFVSFEKTHKIQTKMSQILVNKFKNILKYHKRPRKKVAVLYIVTGRYIVFWDEFYKSCEKHFLKNYKKHYFVFTDAQKLKHEKNKNITKIYQANLGWPDNTLMRFDMFLSQKDKLQNFDYIYFFNANTKFMKTINEKEIIPGAENDNLVVVSHPNFYNKNPKDYTYERDQKSTAYIPFGEGTTYACGALSGGETKAYLDLCKECSLNIHKDKENDIVALWHDESHLNKYILDKKPLVLPVNYLYPEEKWLPEHWYRTNPFRKDIKILSTDKTHPRYGGHAYLRGITDKKLQEHIVFNFLGVKIKLKVKLNKAD